eukprot:scaffold47414_cov29-Tisochrysis_lutea.AAC.2
MHTGVGPDGLPRLKLGKPWGKAVRPSGLSAALRKVFSNEGKLCKRAVRHFVSSSATPPAGPSLRLRPVRPPRRCPLGTPRPRLPLQPARWTHNVSRLDNLQEVLTAEPRWQLVSSSLLFVFEPEAEPAPPCRRASSAGSLSTGLAEPPAAAPAPTSDGAGARAEARTTANIAANVTVGAPRQPRPPQVRECSCAEPSRTARRCACGGEPPSVPSASPRRS